MCAPSAWGRKTLPSRPMRSSSGIVLGVTTLITLPVGPSIGGSCRKSLRHSFNLPIESGRQWPANHQLGIPAEHIGGSGRNAEPAYRLQGWAKNESNSRGDLVGPLS